jgi:hypothetical protein
MKKFIITESDKESIRKLYYEQNTIKDSKVPDKDASFIEKILYLSDKMGSEDGKKSDIPDKKISDTKINEKGQKLLSNPIFKKKLKEISEAIHINEKYIIKLMNHESRLDQTIKNSIGCVGLIQFCPSGGSTKKINGKDYNLEELRNNLELQMDAIKEFWSRGYKTGKIKKPSDLYIYNFFPVAAGKSDDFILQTNSLSAEKIAKSNPIFNKTLGRPINTPLTVGDLNDYYEKTNMV